MKAVKIFAACPTPIMEFLAEDSVIADMAADFLAGTGKAIYDVYFPFDSDGGNLDGKVAIDWTNPDVMALVHDLVS